MATGREPALLIDTTGSQNYSIAPGNPTKRRDVLYQTVKQFVLKAAESDSEGDGVRAVTFARRIPGGTDFVDLGDLNPENFEAKWQSIQWGGQTYIMAGFNHLMNSIIEEMKEKDPKPEVVLLIPTDGALADTEVDPFTQALAGLANLPIKVTAEIALIGHGDDNEGAFETYQGIANRSNGRLRVTSLRGQTDPAVIAQHMMALL